MQPHYEKYIRSRQKGIPIAELRKGVNSQQGTQEVGKGNPLAMFRQQIASNEEAQNRHCSTIITPRAELQNGEGEGKTKTKQDKTEQNRTKNCNKFKVMRRRNKVSSYIGRKSSHSSLPKFTFWEAARKEGKETEWDLKPFIHIICSKPVPKTKTHLWWGTGLDRCCRNGSYNTSCCHRHSQNLPESSKSKRKETTTTWASSSSSSSSHVVVFLFFFVFLSRRGSSQVPPVSRLICDSAIFHPKMSSM